MISFSVPFLIYIYVIRGYFAKARAKIFSILKNY